MKDPFFLSRRQFGIGAGTVVVSLALPLAAKPLIAPPSAKVLAALDVETARLVRGLIRRARYFNLLNERYFDDQKYGARWIDNYWPMVQKADVIYDRLGRAVTREEREVLCWLESIAKSETAMARTPWHPVEGPSNRGRWLEAMFEEAQIRRAEARLAFSWISRSGWCNPCYPGHANIMQVVNDADTAVRTAAHRIRMTLVPSTAGDLMLIRRAWQCRLYRRRCFEVKYYPKVKARHFIAGIVAVRLPPQPECGRMFRYMVPDNSERDGPWMRAARRSARRLA